MRQKAIAIFLVFLCVSAFVLPVAAETRTYTVKAGDTVYLLAKRFGLTTQQLIAMNGLEAPYEIYPGQVLVVGMEEGPEAAPEKSGGLFGLNWGDVTQSYGWLALFAILKLLGVM
ncbi:MAG: LysM peptidoglycan-binding domain-containing protein [Limnochordia bacterium]|jgi:hypothetical protein|nr:LysM peptidoglycan-binding domain-containing protein [Bacillota bacterium]